MRSPSIRSHANSKGSHVTAHSSGAHNRARRYDLKLSARGEMDLAYHGEITTPSQCGRMDQCCAFGARPVLMRFDGDKANARVRRRGCRRRRRRRRRRQLC
eukprot:445789-Pleurochrysis_carterae.AAC.1